MDIQARKLHFVQEFLRVADEELVAKLEKLLLVERKRQLDKDVYPLTMAELNKAIDDSEDDFANGRMATAQNVLKQIDTWK
jgi:hypothetical protein